MYMKDFKDYIVSGLHKVVTLSYSGLQKVLGTPASYYLDFTCLGNKIILILLYS